MGNLDSECVWRILAEELYTKKVCTKMVPKMLSAEQEIRQEICSEFCSAFRANRICWNRHLLVIGLGYLDITEKQNDSTLEVTKLSKS
jgi:hypothetical protein